ncbi:pentapeptide repeat-containing protein [Nonomuraea sp. NPDC050663]|uniref:pentapeptide repeat-containing protein n=1 Tax=Nonomuraea sp. NPDC050663 TaxID=3364370 RepID=UPI0037A0D3FB
MTETPAQTEEDSRLPLAPPVTPEDWSPPAPSAPIPAETPRRALRGRDRWLWVWPLVTLGVMVGVGMLWGSLGTFLSGVIVVAALILFVGDEVLQPGHRLAVTIVAVVLVVTGWLGYQRGLPFFSTETLKPGSAAPAESASSAVDLRGRKLTADDLKGVDLRGADLAGAVLDGLDLHGVDLSGVNAQGASFRRSMLDRARLDDADLRGADLREACLYGAQLRRADLRGVDATGADTTDVVADAETLERAASWPAEGTAGRCGSG